MSEYSDSMPFGGRLRKKGLRLRPWVMLVFPIAAILFQVFVPLYVSLLSYLELPLLVTIYFAMTRRSQVAGIFIGAGIGLAQDALSHEPIGLLGMVKTLTGYTAASLGVRLDTENVLVRFGLGFLGLICHQGLQWGPPAHPVGRGGVVRDPRHILGGIRERRGGRPAVSPIG